MGLFLAMSGTVGAKAAAVEATLRKYAEGNQGKLEKANLTTNDEGCLVISESPDGVTVLYPYGFFDWEITAQFLSQRMNMAVFSFPSLIAVTLK